MEGLISKLDLIETLLRGKTTMNAIMPLRRDVMRALATITSGLPPLPYAHEICRVVDAALKVDGDRPGTDKAQDDGCLPGECSAASSLGTKFPDLTAKMDMEGGINQALWSLSQNVEAMEEHQ